VCLCVCLCVCVRERECMLNEQSSCCNAIQLGCSHDTATHTATHCNTLQHTLQHTATHCNAPHSGEQCHPVCFAHPCCRPPQQEVCSSCVTPVALQQCYAARHCKRLQDFGRHCNKHVALVVPLLRCNNVTLQHTTTHPATK